MAKKIIVEKCVECPYSHPWMSRCDKANVPISIEEDLAIYVGIEIIGYRPIPLWCPLENEVKEERQ